MKILYVLSALDTLNIAVYLPAFSAFVRSLQGTPFTLGVINSSAAFISLLWNPTVGSLSDQSGRKNLLKRCMIFSLIGSLVMATASLSGRLALTSSTALFLVLLGRLIGALGSPVSILLRAIVADVHNTDEDKKAFFNKSAPVLSIAFLLGSLGSGFLSEKSFTLVFLLMALIMFTAAYMTDKNLPNDLKAKNKTKNQTNVLSKVKDEIKIAIQNLKTISWSKYGDLFTIKGFYEFSMSVLVSNIGLILLTEFNIKGRSLGYVFVLTSVFGITSNILKIKLKKVFDKIPDFNKVFVCLSILLVSYLGISIAESVYTFLIFLGFAVMSRAFIDTTLTEIITTKTTENDRGKVISAFDNTALLAMTIAPFLSGIIAQILGERILIASAAIPTSISILKTYKLKNKTK